MAWATMVKFRPLLPQSWEWLNVLCDNMQHLYDNISSKARAIPEPSRLDAHGSNEDENWDNTHLWATTEEKGIEYVMIYEADKRYLWYRYALRSGEEPNDLPHLTFGMDFGSSRHTDGYQLDPPNGGDAWNVIDLVSVRQLIPGMILSVHTVRCAFLRDVSS
jgi:hypothetical protein